MAQDPLKAQDSGKIRMPSVDGGMNKISPKFKMDDKGTKLGGPKGEEARKQKLLERIRKRFERVISAESENRKAASDDLQFVNGKQWPTEVIAQRNLDKRPCLTINKLPTFVHQIVNDQRQNRPSISVSPVGDRGDAEVAKMYRGLIRFIERDCAADIAYDTAFDFAVKMGWGYWRILTEWEAPDSLKQSLVIKRITNPFTVYLGPHNDPTGADAPWGFITDLIPREEFDDKYPDADPMPFTEAGIGEAQKNWINKDEVRVAEYFEVTYETRTYVELSNGHEGWEDELDDVTLGYIKRGKIDVLDERESRVPKWKWYKVTAVDVLREDDWLGTTIPIVKIVGDENNIEGKAMYSGIVRNAKDSQRMYNYWKTSETELIALAPKAPFIGEEGQFEGHEDEWKASNVRSQPYLSYKGTSLNGVPIPPPQRQQFAGVPAGVVQAAQGAAQDMMATTGVRFDASPNERMIDESGKAIRELRRSGDLGNFHFVDNLARSLRRTGEILVELIPLTYSDARTITILREDDKEEQVRIDPSAPKASGEMKKPDGKSLKIFNPKYGKYGVTVTIGPSYATKRIEAAESMVQFAKALPQTAALIADLIAKNSDWPGAEEIAARLAKTLPPNLLQPDMKDVPPQVQALLSSQDAQVKDLGQKLQAAIAQLNDKKEDRALLEEKISKDFEAKLLKIVADTESKTAQLQEAHAENINTHIGAQIKELGTGVTALMQQLANPTAGAEAKPADPNELPPEALQHLKEGRATTFGNGQKWTMRGGKPERAA